jgi:CRISPR-associated protein Cmr2
MTMPIYLVTISLGPVQSLIEAARRTRDLWCGSWLLSESARAAALKLHEQHPGCLIFPYLQNPDEDLMPQKTPKDDANIANVLRAQIDAETDGEIRALCEAAKRAAVDRLEGLCKDARGEVPELPLHEDLWKAQTRDILEYFAAWTLVPEGKYQEASKRLGGLLAARKATRDFEPAATGPNGLGYGIPKSSLDAGRESVIAVHRRDRGAPEYRRAVRKLGLARGEELDALGLAKRRAGQDVVEQFTAYPRIAADPWIRSLTPEQQRIVSDTYRPLVDCGLATGVKGNQNPNIGESIYAAMPFDAALLYDFRLANALNGNVPKDDDQQTLEDKKVLGLLDNVLRGIRDEPNKNGTPVGSPVPYAAILKADGDRMGTKLLPKATSADESRDISRCLHGFACAVREIVRDCNGHAVYSGGDDVLSLVPLDQAMKCARRLADSFKERMEGIAKRLGLPEKDWPTLSVGLGIGHLMEPLGNLRARAERAEKAAKGNALPQDEQRNALAIHLGIRSGAEYCWRAQWTKDEAFDDLQRFARAFQQRQVPSRVPYDLRAIAGRPARLDAWTKEQGREDPERIETVKQIRRSEVVRMLERARTEGGTKASPMDPRDPQIPSELQDLILKRAEHQPLDTLADSLIVARWLSARTASDLGEYA